MQRAQASLFTRDDTFFGVCEGLGADLRIHPNILRVAFAGFLFWNPIMALATYAAAGLVVMITRWLVPDLPVAEPQPQPQLTPQEGDEDQAAESVPLAA